MERSLPKRPRTTRPSPEHLVDIVLWHVKAATGETASSSRRKSSLPPGVRLMPPEQQLR